jgi:hypothetical protein
MLMKEHARLTHMKNSATSDEAWRYGQIMEKAILPAVTEMLCSIQLFYPNADITGLLDIIEEGIDFADSNSRRIKRELHPVNGSPGD